MKPKKTTLNALIAEKMAALEAEGKIGTRYNYRTLLHYIEERWGLVPMSDVNPLFAKRMKKTMATEGKSPSTQCNYFAMLMAIFNYAVYKGYAKSENYPLRKNSYELDKPAKPKPAKRTEWCLKKEQMQKIWEEWKKDPNPSHKRNVGMFLCSYLMNGANLADIMRLKYDKSYYRSGRTVLTFIRLKTKGRSDAKVTVPIIPQLKEIIELIGDKEKPDGYVFGSFMAGTDMSDNVAVAHRVMYLNTHISRELKIWCQRRMIADHISMTYARHTYATVSTMEGVPFYVVERALGHSLGGTADNYVGHTTPEKMAEYNSRLL